MPEPVLAPQWSSIDAILAAHPELKLDLGCGYMKPDGYVGLDNLVGLGDQHDLVGDVAHGPDVFCELNHEPYPFPDGCAAEIRSRHFLEHSHLDHVFTQSARLLRPGGRFIAIVPYALSEEGLMPGHHVFLTETFFRLNKTFQADFEIVRETYRQSESWLAWPRVVRRLIPYDWARRHLFNVCSEMRIEAVKRPR